MANRWKTKKIPFEMLKKPINKPIISFRIGTEARWHKAALLGVVLLVFSWRTRAAYANVRFLYVNVVIITVILQWKYCCLSKPVSRIHDILGCIRIRIRGSMPMTNGSGFGSGSWILILLFSSFTIKLPAKNEFFNSIFSAFYFLKPHLHHFSKIKSQ